MSDAPARPEHWCRVPGCRRKKPLPAKQRGYQCTTCQRALRDRRPQLYRGPCVCGCGEPAGGRSALARLCRLRADRRRKVFKRVMRQLCGIPLPADHLAIALKAMLPLAMPLEARRAMTALFAMLEALHRGHVMLNRYSPVARRRARCEEATPGAQRRTS